MLATLFVLAAALSGQAQPAPEASDELAPLVRRLVRDLDARELATRQQAEQRLLELGPGVLEHLPVVTDRTAAEIRQRTGRIRTLLQRQRAEASAQASRVTLSAQAMPLSEVFAEFERQTGNKVFDYRREFGQNADDPPLAIDFDDEPFWPAFDQVLDQAKLTVYPYASERGIAVVNRGTVETSRSGRAAYSGAFRIEATEVVAQRDLRDSRNRSLNLKLEIAWEPRLAPIALKHSLSELAATDDQGQPVQVAGYGHEIEAPLTHGAMAAEIEVPLIPPPRTVERIGRLQGQLTAVLPGRAEAFRFADLDQAEPSRQHQAGVSVQLERVRKNNEIWETRIRVAFDEPGEALESHRDWMFYNEALLEDADGNVRLADGLETTLQTASEFGVAYLFDVPDLAGQTFVYKTPTVILHVPLKYELSDLELP